VRDDKPQTAGTVDTDTDTAGMMSAGAGLTNVYLEKLARQFAPQTFCGVYSSDTLPRKLATSRRQRFSIICNLSRRHEEGTHFVAVAATSRSVYYLDPTGLPCVDACIISFLSECGRDTIYFNKQTIQHPMSYFCGYYALLFILRFDRGAGWQTNLFVCDKRDSADLFANDTLCVHYLKHELSRDRKLRK
jgi:hypothetical protein